MLPAKVLNKVRKACEVSWNLNLGILLRAYQDYLSSGKKPAIIDSLGQVKLVRLKEGTLSLGRQLATCSAPTPHKAIKQAKLMICKTNSFANHSGLLGGLHSTT